MRELSITVRERIAKIGGSPEIVCGNSGYTAVFDLDAEWSAYPVKTMRIAWIDPERPNRMLYMDVLFEGNRAILPPLYGMSQIWLGIFAGDILTTTSVRIPCCFSEMGSSAVHPEPESDIYIQLLEYLKQLQTEQTYAGAAIARCSGAEGLCGKPIGEEAV